MAKEKRKEKAPPISLGGSITVKKEKLLDIVKENKTKHDVIYSGALEGHKFAVNSYLNDIKGEADRVKSLITECAKLAAQGKKFEDNKLLFRNFSYPSLPVSYAFEYDKAIMKLELATAKEILLTESEFNQYVMNNWSWKSSFSSSNISYANAYSNLLVCSGRSFTGHGISLTGALSAWNQ